MGSRSDAIIIADHVYAERAAKCTPEERAKAREFLDLRNCAGFDEQLRIVAQTLECRRCNSVLAGDVGEPEPSPDAFVCAAIERGLCLVDFYGSEFYRIPSRREV